jgi:hypothetical protein
MHSAAAVILKYRTSGTEKSVGGFDRTPPVGIEGDVIPTASTEFVDGQVGSQ